MSQSGTEGPGGAHMIRDYFITWKTEDRPELGYCTIPAESPIEALTDAQELYGFAPGQVTLVTLIQR